ncbi:hypothetical protein BZM27_27055 [Paraburkholderia steynii]|uniref:Tyr recombinase domain-containing protein n=1 Tax=Paraburkholderia steynii TaxID=1245441 RepID=A0A4V2NGV4_9BURK|nr:hypothetical protein BZM27_27055 [Paraburkholderia steynii]
MRVPRTSATKCHCQCLAERSRRARFPTFFQDEVQRLVEDASQSGYRSLRRRTYSTLFALLACTGLRVSEAIQLRFDDITQDGLVS